MVKGLLKDEERDKFEEELATFSLMEDYLSKTGKTQLEFTSIRRMQELELGNGALKIPNILAMQSVDGKTELLNITKQEYDREEIEELSKRTGLDRNDIILLLQDGMKIEEISDFADNLPFKEIADSAAIREMIRKEIDPAQLALMHKKGIEIVPASDGSLEVTNIQHLADVDEKGLVELDQDLVTSLKPFEEFGLIKVSKELVVKELEPQEMEKVKGKSLQVVSLEEKKAEITKEEIEKQRMAKSLGIDSSEIVSMIRIEDREEGSRLLNDEKDKNSSKYIIRTRNGIVGNKFIVAKEVGEGKFEQLQGFESTPVAKNVASLLHDTQNSIDGVALKPGEIKAGKMHSMDNEYSYYQIRRAGESKDDDSNTLLFVGTMGDTDMELIESRDNGDKSFVRLPVSSVHPRNIYMENNSTSGRETQLIQDDTEKEENSRKPETVDFKDISKKRELLERLIKIEKQIREIEGKTGHDEQCIDDCIRHEDEQETQKGSELIRDIDAFENTSDPERKLPDLYSQRSTLLRQLGIDEVTAVKEQEEEEMEIGVNRRHH